MFTKEKLEKWINALENVFDYAYRQEIWDLQDLKTTLEKLYTTMTKED